MQKVLVTGATGFIGIEVSRHLADRGLRPRFICNLKLPIGLYKARRLLPLKCPPSQSGGSGHLIEFSSFPQLLNHHKEALSCHYQDNHALDDQIENSQQVPMRLFG